MLELPIQITDRSGNIIGSVDMIEAFNQQLIRNVVYVMLINADGKYLLQQRSINAPNYPGCWECSAGGHVDISEEAEKAAYRELNEELGVRDILLNHVTNFYFESEGDGRVYKYYAHVYSGESDSIERLNVNLLEVDSVKFFEKGEIDKLPKVTPITRKIVTLL